jgi:hypothetical protein
MKKLILPFVVLLLAAAVYAEQVPLWSATISVDCGGLCLESLPAAWGVDVANTGNVSFKIQQVQLLDFQGLLIASSQPGDLELQPGKQASVAIQGLLPPPTRSYTLFYKVCYFVNGQTSCEINPRRMSVMPLTEVECLNNQSCDPGKACIGLKCLPKTALMNNTQFAKYKSSDISGKDYAFFGMLFLILVLLVLIFIKRPRVHHAQP